MLNRDDLHSYQHKGVELILEQKKLALWFLMGMGKTPTTLTAIKDLMDGIAINKTLVIAPLRVANSVWHKEAFNWSHLKDLTFSICTGTQPNRLAKLNAKADIYVINRENIPWLVEHYKSKWPFDCVVIDESDSFKNQSSRRWKTLRKIMPKVEYLVQLTGTPSPNGLLDIWAQMYLLDGGKALGRNMTAYKNKYYVSDYMGFSWILKDGADVEIHKAVEHLVYCPEKVVTTKRVDIVRSAVLPPALEKQYRVLEKEFLIELENVDITAMSAAALSNKLLQYCNGIVYDEDKNHIHLHDLKIEMLKEVIEEAKAPVLVFYNYKSDLANLLKHFKKAVPLDTDPTTIDKWNEGKIDLLLAHPASSGHGINLQSGGSICVWYGLTWNLGNYQQAVARLDRQGQKETVRNIHLVIEGAIDERVLSAIEGKAKTQHELLEYMKCK